MRKLSKSALALLLAGTMAFMPAADILAADNTDNINLTVTETEDITQESDAAETDGSATETNTDADSNDDKDSNPDANNEVGGDDNTDSEAGDTKENDETGSETGNIDNSDLGNDSDSDSKGNDNSEPDADTETDQDLEDDNADIQDSDDESDSETGDLDSEEADSEQDSDDEVEEEFPGLVNYALSTKQLEDKKDLAAHLDEITNGDEGTDYVSRELVFAASTLAEAEKIAAAYGAELKDFDEGIGVLILPENISVSHALTVAATSRDVVLPVAWPNYIYKTCSDTDENINNEVAASDETYLNDNAYTEAVKAYSDPFLSPANENYQYQHAVVGSTYAWNAGYKGAGIKIAILDTGVNHHGDLNVVYDYNFSIEKIKDEDLYPTALDRADHTDTDDKDGHGTHVAGLAAAKANTTGGAGIAPEAQIYNIRVLNSEGAGTTASTVRGVNHAVSQKVDIINMSLGGPGYAGVYDKAITDAYNAGIIVIAAAGNDGSKVKCYPACYKNAICVGAVDANKGRTYFSNYGSWVNFSAPGMSLVSTSISGEYSITVDGAIYEEMSGTSQATPVVSGTAAVILSADESIRSKKGTAKVDALISKMNKGKIAGSGGAAGIVSLAKALDIPVSTAAPKAPVFEQTDKIVNNGSLTVSIKAASPSDVVYYSIDGKNPTYKNGVLDNATQYTGSFTIGGSAKITVKAIAVNACGLVSKVAAITYTFKPKASAVNITGQSGLLKGKSTTLKATVEPAYAANKKVTWTSSAPNQVSVSASGKVTATNSAVVGTSYTITAKSADGNAEGTFQIIVSDKAKISAVAFKNSAGKAQKSDVISNATTDYDLAPLLKVTGTDKKEMPNPVDEVSFTSSNIQVAVVDSKKSGNIKIVGVGKAVITATANDGSGKKATFTLTVGKKITTLTISGSSMLVPGKSAKLTATVNKDAANKKYDWSISPDNKGVTVNNGTVKALKTATAGTYIVTATAKDGSGCYDTKEIKVSNTAITKIQLDKKSETIFRKAGNHSSKTSISITATITGGDASGIEFTSSNPGVATVTQSGAKATVTATGKVTGTTKITCKAANGKSAACTIKVVNPPSHLSITPPAGLCCEDVAKGKKMKLTAVFEEEFGSVSSKKATWTSSNKSIATVDKNGNVKGLAIGYTDITATANDGSGLTAQYTIYVSDPIKTLGLYAFEASGEFVHVTNVMNVNDKYTIPILYNGRPYTQGSLVCPDVAIEVGNPDIISVQQIAYGVYDIYTLKTGSTTITVKALDGTGVKKSYSVKVK